MAPKGEMLASSFLAPVKKPQRLPTEGLQRAMSDLSFTMIKEELDVSAGGAQLPPVSEVEDATCECCGMSEECTLEYVAQVRGRFSGRWICGLCTEAVKEEMAKNGGRKDEALDVHVSACARFNKFGRTHPVLYQAEAMRDMLQRCSSRGAMLTRAKSTSPRDKSVGVLKKGSITRSSSCIPAITKEIQETTL